MAINEIPVTIDYTSRDYEALREELVARIKERSICVSRGCRKLLY
jgi:hypothetical protein